GLVFLASGRAIGDMFTKRQIERGENDVARYLVRCLEATVATLDVAAPANAPDSRGMDKQTSRQLIARVDAVLWEVWDPIGVNHEPLARDEYSSYAPDVAALLRAGAADAEIERHLSAIVLDRMGMSWVNPERTRRTLAALRAIAVAALPPFDASLP
ncbi:MAG TPA: hypothetical protein VEW03_00300, partial [Longimicrobiaceae bacterium]|nr:hypothetical protein [Longimicrobiaceae bacterium]